MLLLGLLQAQRRALQPVLLVPQLQALLLPGGLLWALPLAMPVPLPQGLQLVSLQVQLVLLQVLLCLQLALCPQLALLCPQLALLCPQLALCCPQQALCCLQQALMCPQLVLSRLQAMSGRVQDVLHTWRVVFQCIWTYYLLTK